VSARLSHRFDGPEEAPVLVLSGSLGTTAAMWDDLVPGLANRYRVLRYDHRGHGGSEAPPGPYSIEEMAADVLALLDLHQVSKASFCGLSIGGMVGLSLAAGAPERVERLALLCTSAHLGVADAWDERIAAVEREGVGSIADAVVGRWFTEAFAAREPRAVARWREELAATPAGGYAACCAAIRDFDARERLAGITAPTLVLTALQDRAIPVDHQAALAASIGGARMTVLDGAAHLAPVERPGPVAAAILDHLGDSPDPRRELGMAVRREVLGEAHVDAATAAASAPVAADFQRYLTRAAWGDVWSRGGIDRRMRSAITLTALLAANRMEEFEMHVRAARRNGLEAEEIGEIVLHAAVYLGMPAANDGFRSVTRALGDDT